MANRRELKKDINYLIGELVSDCYLHMHFHKEADQDKVVEVLAEAVILRNNLMTQASSAEKKGDKKATKAEYRAVYTEMLNSVDALFTKLSSLSK